MAFWPRPYGLGAEAIPRAVAKSKSGRRIAGAGDRIGGVHAIEPTALHK